MRKMKRFTIALLMAVMSFACVLGLSACEFIGNRDQLDNAHEHVFVVDKKTEATCTQDGVTTYKCSHEGCTETKAPETVAKFGHKWDNGRVTTEATCVAAGVTTYSCTNGCGETKTETGVKANHNVSKVEAVAATCTKAGSIEYYTCSYCGTYFKNQAATETITEKAIVVPATGHNAIKHAATEATCTVGGNIEYWTCNNDACKGVYYTTAACDVAVEKVTTTPTGHSAKEVKAKAAGCTELGNKQYWVCENAACTDKKYADSKCTVEITAAQFDANYVIAANGHKFSAVVKAQDATCLEDGWVEHKKCTTCNKFFNKDAASNSTETINKDVKAFGHTFGEVVAKQDETCTVDGHVAYKPCTTCNKKFAENAATNAQPLTDAQYTIKATHKISATLTKEQPTTCLVPGVKAHYTCDREGCNVKFDEKTKNAVTDEQLAIATLDHKLENGKYNVAIVSRKAPTCEADGHEAGLKCAYDCGKYIVSDQVSENPQWVDSLPVIPKIDHNYVENGFEARLNVKAAAPTCLNIGIKQYWVCTGACNDVYVKDADGNYVVALQDYDDTTKYADDRYLKDAVVAALTIDPIAHKNADGTMATIHTPGLAATCFVNGNVENWYCTICGRHYANATCTDDQFIDEGKLVINAIAHKGYMTKSPAQPSTCTATGYYEYYTCSYVTTDGVACCDGIYFRDVNGTERYANADALVEPMKAHITTYKAASESSCIAEGNYEYWYCSTCATYYKDEACTEEYTESVVIAKLPHATIQVEGKAATCLESGYEAYEYCTNTDYCNYTTFKAVNAKGHSFVDFEAKAPTCLEKGWSAHKKCYDCEKSFYAAAPVDSDKAFAWDKFDIAPVEHTVAAGALVYTAYAAPTCVDEGNEEFWQCKFCAKYFDAADGSVTLAAKPVIAALGHDWAEIGARAATCTKPGYEMVYMCLTCDDYKYDDKIAATGHAFVLQNAVAPSCTEDGKLAWNKCTNACCEGKMYAANATMDTEVTITEADIVDAKLGHEFTSFVYNAPKCLTAGNIAYEFCSTCLKMYAENSNQYVAEENALDGDDVTIPATGHALVYVNFKAPTCTEYGWVAHWHCENECGICYEEEAATTVIAEPIIKALGHVGQMTAAVAATCLEDGTVEYWTCIRTYDYDGDGVEEACKCCTGKYYATKVVNDVKNADFDNELTTIVAPAHGHKFGSVPYQAPTCTEIGFQESQYCFACRKVFAKDAATDSTEGSDDMYKYQIAALGHVYSYHEAVAATCLKDGNVAYYNCLTCKLYFADEAGTPISTIKDPVKGHKPQYHAAVAPTCLKDGTVEYWTCENAFCDNGVDTMYSDAACTVVLADNTDAAVSHAPKYVEAKAPTCTEAGTIAYYICENTCCDYAAGTMFKEAACETVLPDEEAITDPAIGHAPLFYEAIAPTCEKDGAKAYYTCTNECCIGKAFTSADCSVEITAVDYVVPATGHAPQFVAAQPATCLEDGMYAYYYCANEMVEIEYLTVDGGVSVVPAVFYAAVKQADGSYKPDYTTPIYDVDTFIQVAVGHDFNNASFDYNAPDCTTAGNEAYVFCTNCYNKFAAGSGVFTAESEALEEDDIVIPALKHHFVDYVKGIAPTCTTPGSVEYWYCDVCETRYTDNGEVTTNSIEEEEIYIEALGHTTTFVEYVAPLCTEDGNIAHWLCSVCGHTYADELGEVEYTNVIINKLNHDPVYVAPEAATCETFGWVEHFYCNNERVMLFDEEDLIPTVYYGVKVDEEGNKVPDYETIIDDPYLAAFGHKPVFVPAVNVTCLEDGNIAYFYCENECIMLLDGETLVPAVFYEAVEQEDGSFVPNYGRMLDYETEIVIYADGHAFGPMQTSEPTCTEPGYGLIYFCADCAINGTSSGYYKTSDTQLPYSAALTYEDGIVAPLGHDLSYHSAVAPTCVEAGHTAYYYCARCELTFETDAKDATTAYNPNIPALGHTPVYVEKVDSTCFEDGNEAYWICQTKYNYGEGEVACACCEGKFYADEECTVELNYNDNILIAQKEHVWVMVEYKNSTCFEDGNEAYFYCMNECMQLLVNDTLVPMVYYGVTTDENGDRVADVNNVLDYEEDILIEQKEHVWHYVPAVNVTCLEDGNIAYFWCENECVELFENAKAPTTFYAAKVVVDAEGNPVLDADDNVQYVADLETELDYDTEIMIYADGHAFGPMQTSEPTCTEPGYGLIYFCADCAINGTSSGYYKTSDTQLPYSAALTYEDGIVAPLGHVLSYHSAVAPTCVEAGHTAYYYCSRCELTFETDDAYSKTAYNQNIPAIGHSAVKTEFKAPTCTTYGNVEYWTCEAKYDYDGDGVAEPCECCDGKYYEDEACTVVLATVAIKPFGHTFKHVPFKAPTCTTFGNVEHFICTSTYEGEACECCDGKYYDVIYDNDMQDNIGIGSGFGTAPTAHPNTGKVLETVAIKPLNHTFEFVPAVEPTCTEDGNVAYFICTTKYEGEPCECCNGKKYDVIYDNDMQDNIGIGSAFGPAPTAYPNTGKVLENVVLTKVGHSFNYVDPVAPTCTETGVKGYFTCSNACCVGVKYESNTDVYTTVTVSDAELVVAALGHKLKKLPYQAPKCEEAGHIECYTCETCKLNFAGNDEMADPATALTNEQFIIPATGHLNVVATSAKEATCFAEGNIAYWTCPACEKIYSDAEYKVEISEEEISIEKLAHAYVEHAATDDQYAYWTCESEKDADGNYIYFKYAEGAASTEDDKTFANYDATFKPGASCQHTNKIPMSAQAATCQAPGTIAYDFCPDCFKMLNDAGEILTEADIIEAQLSHASNGIQVKETPDTYAHYVCVNGCNGTFADADCTNPIDINKTPVVHTCSSATVTLVFGTAATCKVAGKKDSYECECGKVYLNADATGEVTDPSQLIAPVDSSNHNLIPMDEDQNFYKRWFCEWCGKYFRDANGTNEFDPTIQPDDNTCTQHVTADATECNSQQVCDNCGESYTLAHVVIVAVKSQASTCTQQGWEMYHKCGHCNTILYNGGQIPYLPLADHVDNDNDGKCDNCHNDMPAIVREDD